MVNLIKYYFKIMKNVFVFFRTDGILSTLMRIGVAAENDDKRWYIFDGKSLFSSKLIFKNKFFFSSRTC